MNFFLPTFTIEIASRLIKTLRPYLPAAERWTPIVWVIALGVFMWPCLDANLIGFISDDGIYALSAKSLSQGRGMQMQHMVPLLNQVRYPMGYPLLLAPVWWLFPDSPANMHALSAYTLLWSLLGLWLSQQVMRQIFGWPLWSRLLLMTAMAGNFFFLYHATTVMSEGPYLAVTMAALLAAWQWRRNPTVGNRWFVGLVILSVLAFHLRLMGIAFIAALTVWLLLLGHIKRGVCYGLISLLATVIPWGGWVALNGPKTINQANIAFWGTISDYMSVLKLEVFSNRANPWLLYLQRLQIAASDGMLGLLAVMMPFLLGIPLLPEARSFFMAWPWLIPVQDGLTVIGIFALAFRLLLLAIQSVSKMGQVATLEPEKQIQWLIGLYLAIYSFLIVAWAYPGQGYRFLMLTIPLLWGVVINNWVTRRPVLTGILLMLACAWSLQSYDMVRDLRQNNVLAYQPAVRYYWQDLKSSYHYIRTHLPKTAVIGAGRDVPLYLNTGRKTFHVYRDSIMPNNLVKPALVALEKQMDACGVRYLLLELNIINYKLSDAPINPVIHDIVVNNRPRYRIIYQSPQGMTTLFERQPSSPPPYGPCGA